MNIIVCGEDQTNQDVLRILLERKNYTTYGCAPSDVADAVLQFDADVLFIDSPVDHSLPHKIERLCQVVRLRVPAIFLVGGDRNGCDTTAPPLCVAGNISKPIDPEEVGRLLRLIKTENPSHHKQDGHKLNPN